MAIELQVVLPNGRVYNNARLGVEAFAGSIQNLIPADQFSKITQRELRKYLKGVAKKLGERHSSSWKPFTKLPTGTRAGRLSRRTGKLISAIERSVEVTVNGQVVVGDIGRKGVPRYAIVHETGATITPKNSQYLTIPLPAALDSRGVPRRPNSRQWKNTFVVKSKAGNLVIVQRRGFYLAPLYILKKSVRIEPRLGLGATIQDTRGDFVDAFYSAIMKEMRKRQRTGR